MTLKNNLFLYEEIMLLSLRDQEGTVEPMISYREAIAGSILAELLLQNYIELDQSKKSNPLRVLKGGPIGDELLDECLEKITASKRRKTLQTWVMRFSNIKKLKHRIAGNLSNKGILAETEDKVMLLFTRKIYPEVNSEPEQMIIERMRDAIFTDTYELDAKTTVLISLVHHTGLLKRIFDKSALKSRKKRIEQIINGEAVGKATKKAIEAVQAALLTAVITPSIIAASTS